MEKKLSGSNCRRFSIHSHFTVSREVDDQIQKLMKETRHQSHEPEGLHQLANYGSKFIVGDTTVVAAGVLVRGAPERDEDDAQPGYWVDLTYFVRDNDVPPPPDGVKPVSNILEIGLELFGNISIDYRASFTYKIDDGIESRVSIPIPLILSDQSSNLGLTHIESVELSRREDSSPTHTVTVELSDDKKLIHHTVNFSARSNLNQANMMQALDTSCKLSETLVTRQHEES